MRCANGGFGSCVRLVSHWPYWSSGSPVGPRPRPKSTRNRERCPRRPRSCTGSSARACATCSTPTGFRRAGDRQGARGDPLPGAAWRHPEPRAIPTDGAGPADPRGRRRGGTLTGRPVGSSGRNGRRTWPSRATRWTSSPACSSFGAPRRWRSPSSAPPFAAGAAGPPPISPRPRCLTSTSLQQRPWPKRVPDSLPPRGIARATGMEWSSSRLGCKLLWGCGTPQPVHERGVTTRLKDQVSWITRPWNFGSDQPAATEYCWRVHKVHSWFTGSPTKQPARLVRRHDPTGIESRVWFPYRHLEYRDPSLSPWSSLGGGSRGQCPSGWQEGAREGLS